MSERERKREKKDTLKIGALFRIVGMLKFMPSRNSKELFNKIELFCKKKRKKKQKEAKSKFNTSAYKRDFSRKNEVSQNEKKDRTKSIAFMNPSVMKPSATC